MELLAGAYLMSTQFGSGLGFPVLRLGSLADHEAAAELCRCCRLAGRTVRKRTDCPVAVSTISASGTLLHRDADFDTLAAHTPLRPQPLAENSAPRW